MRFSNRKRRRNNFIEIVGDIIPLYNRVIQLGNWFSGNRSVYRLFMNHIERQRRSRYRVRWNISHNQAACVRFARSYTHLTHCRSVRHSAAAFAPWWSRAVRKRAAEYPAGSTRGKRPRRETGKTGTRSRTSVESSRSSAASCACNSLHHYTRAPTHQPTRRAYHHHQQHHHLPSYSITCPDVRRLLVCSIETPHESRRAACLTSIGAISLILIRLRT